MPVQRQPFSCVRMYVFAAKARQARWCVCSPLGRGHCSEFRLRKILLLNAQFREAAIVDAICAGQLPEWYEKEVRNGGDHLSYYAKALADGDHFKDIQWDRQRLAQLQFTSKSKSHCFGIGQDVEVHSLKGEAGEKYNGRIAQVLNTTHPSIKEKLVVVIAGRKLGIRPENLREAKQCPAAGLKQREAQAHGPAKVEEDISSTARCTSLQANTGACSSFIALNSKVCAAVHCTPSVMTECPSRSDDQTDVDREVERANEEARNRKLLTKRLAVQASLVGLTPAAEEADGPGASGPATSSNTNLSKNACRRMEKKAKQRCGKQRRDEAKQKRADE